MNTLKIFTENKIVVLDKDSLVFEKKCVEWYGHFLKEFIHVYDKNHKPIEIFHHYIENLDHDDNSVINFYMALISKAVEEDVNILNLVKTGK